MPSSSYFDLGGFLVKLHAVSPEAAQKVCEVVRENPELFVRDDFKPEPVNIKAAAKYECMRDHPFEVHIDTRALPRTHPYYRNLRKLLGDLSRKYSYAMVTSVDFDRTVAYEATVYVDLDGAAYLSSLYSSAVIKVMAHDGFTNLARIEIKKFEASTSNLVMEAERQKWLDWANEHLTKPILFYMSEGETPLAYPKMCVWYAYTTDEDEARMFKLFWTNR